MGWPLFHDGRGDVKGGTVHEKYPFASSSKGPLNIGISKDSIWNCFVENLGIEGDAELNDCPPTRERTGSRYFRKRSCTIPTHESRVVDREIGCAPNERRDAYSIGCLLYRLKLYCLPSEAKALLIFYSGLFIITGLQRER